MVLTSGLGCLVFKATWLEQHYHDQLYLKLELVFKFANDVANTYLVYLRFQLMLGHLGKKAYEQEVALVRDTIKSYEGAHWDAYLEAWT